MNLNTPGENSYKNQHAIRKTIQSATIGVGLFLYVNQQKVIYYSTCVYCKYSMDTNNTGIELLSINLSGRAFI